MEYNLPSHPLTLSPSHKSLPVSDGFELKFYKQVSNETHYSSSFAIPLPFKTPSHFT